MSVMTYVRRNEVVSRGRMIGQIGRQLVICPHMRDTFGGLRIQAGVDVVEKWKGEMLDIQEREIKRTYVEYGASEVGFRISFPGNACVLQKLYKMLVRE